MVISACYFENYNRFNPDNKYPEEIIEKLLEQCPSGVSVEGLPGDPEAWKKVLGVPYIAQNFSNFFERFCPSGNVCGDLSGLDLSNAKLALMDFRKATLKGGYLPGAKLNRAIFSGMNLSNINLRGANLYIAKLDKVNLHGADLSNADLRYADFRGLDLTNTNLAGANMKEVRFDHLTKFSVEMEYLTELM